MTIKTCLKTYLRKYFASSFIAKTLLFQGEPVLGSFFTLRPWKVAGIWIIAVVVFLDFPAWIIGVHSVKTLRGDWGFFHGNWAMAFTVWLPVIFGGCAWISRRLSEAVNLLIRSDVQVITTYGGKEHNKKFLDAFAARMASRSFCVFWEAVALAIILSCLDTYDLWEGYYTYLNSGIAKFDPPRIHHWNTAFLGWSFFSEPTGSSFITSYVGLMSSPLGQGPLLAASELCPGSTGVFWNLFFNIIAYIFQGLAIFLGCFFGFKFLTFFLALAHLSFRKNARFPFNPMWHDPQKRLGLRPLAPAFNGFMFLTVVFQFGVLWHRLELIIHHSATNNSLGKYIQKLANIKEDTFDALTKADLYELGTIDLGGLLAMVTMAVPVAFICYFPLRRLRRHLTWKAAGVWALTMRQHDNAVENDDAHKAKKLKALINSRLEATIWPNGFATALRYLFLMGALILAAWVPPVLAYLVGLGIVVELLKIPGVSRSKEKA
jgi:hypothetical protein